MSAALRARVTAGHLIVIGAESLPEGMEFDLVPVLSGQTTSITTPANDRSRTLLDLIACEIPDEAFDSMLDRARDLPRDPGL